MGPPRPSQRVVSSQQLSEEHEDVRDDDIPAAQPDTMDYDADDEEARVGHDDEATGEYDGDPGEERGSVLGSDHVVDLRHEADDSGDLV